MGFWNNHFRGNVGIVIFIAWIVARLTELLKYGLRIKRVQCHCGYIYAKLNKICSFLKILVNIVRTEEFEFAFVSSE